jgi:hypothetical protein
MAASVRLSRHPLPREQPRQPRAPLQRDERVGAAYQRALSGDRGTARPTAEVEVRASSASQNVKPSPEVLKAPPSESRFAADSLSSARPADRYSAHRVLCIALQKATCLIAACNDQCGAGVCGYGLGALGHPRVTRRLRLGVRIVNHYGCTHRRADGMPKCVGQFDCGNVACRTAFVVVRASACDGGCACCMLHVAT